MDKLTATFRKLHNFIFFEIDPFILGLFRIALGVFFLLYYFMLAPSWIAYYGPNGISPWPTSSPKDYILFDSILNYIAKDSYMWLFFGISTASAAALAAGVLGRLPQIWLWVANFSIIFRNTSITNGEEQVMAVLLFFSMFLPLDSALKFKLFKKTKEKAHKVTAWALRPLQLQIALIYALSLPHKFLSDTAWIDGTIVYFAITSIQYSRWPGLEIFAWANAALSRALTFFTVIIEFLLPLLVWLPRFRLPLVLSAILLHIGLAIFLEGLFMFNLSMITALILFLPSKKTRLWFENYTAKVLKVKKRLRAKIA